MRYLPKIYIAVSLFAYLLANNFLSIPPMWSTRFLPFFTQWLCNVSTMALRRLTISEIPTATSPSGA